MRIKFAGCFLDHSGYAQAARSLLLAMDKVGINITTFMLAYQQGSLNLGEGGQLAKKLQDKQLDYDIKLMMITPDQAALQREEGKYNICAMFWEVLGLDKRWVESMNKLDEIWTTSQTFADTFKHNGVYKPIKVIKPIIETSNKIQYKKLKIEGFDGFLFYSIFQWTERKNPRALLETYWQTFTGKKDVALLLKVYEADFSEFCKDKIRNDIKTWKKELGLKHYPKVFLVLDEVSTTDIMRIHSTGDCLVSAHRGEGLGMPQIEAMSIGNPIISTNFGGVHELLDNKNSWLIDYDLTQVFNMGHIVWYNAQQLWAEIKTHQLGNSMLEAYSNQKLTKQKGRLAKEFIKNNLSMQNVGNEILIKLKEIKL